MNANKKIKFKEVIKGDKPVLVDFFATWCGPCKALSPVITQVKKDLDGKMKVVKIDVDKNKNISAKYGIKSLPTLAIFQNGEIVWRETGMKTQSQLLRVANRYLDEPAGSQESSKGGSWLSRLFGK
jgi:thioredoxin 1